MADPIQLKDAYAWLARARSYRYVFSEDPMRAVIDALPIRSPGEAVVPGPGETSACFVLYKENSLLREFSFS